MRYLHPRRTEMGEVARVPLPRSATGLQGVKHLVDKMDPNPEHCSNLITVSTGCLKATKVDKLRALVGMRSMREIGETEAALVIEKSLRMDSDTPVVRASHARVLKSKRQVGS